MRYEQNLNFKDFLEIQKKPMYEYEEIKKKRKEFIGSTNNSASFKGSLDFTGSENLFQSIEFLEYGFKNNPLEKGDLLEKLNINSKNDKIYLDYQGLCLDFSEYASGNPECMINLQYTYEKAKNINIYFNSGFNCDINNNTINLYGKMILSLIELLETQGINTSLYSYFKSEGSERNTFQSIIKLKNFDEIIDTDRISYCITHPSFLRRNLFKLMEETIPFKVLQNNFSGYGRSIHTIEKTFEDAIYINSLENNQGEEYFLKLLESTVKEITENFK